MITLWHCLDARSFRALWALEEIGPEAEAAVPDLLRALRHNPPVVGRRICEVLVRIGPAAVPALVALFGRTNWWLPHTPGCFGSSPPQTRPSQRPTRRRSAPGASRR